MRDLPKMQKNHIHKGILSNNQNFCLSIWTLTTTNWVPKCL